MSKPTFDLWDDAMIACIDHMPEELADDWRQMRARVLSWLDMELHKEPKPAWLVDAEAEWTKQQRGPWPSSCPRGTTG